MNFKTLFIFYELFLTIINLYFAAQKPVKGNKIIPTEVSSNYQIVQASYSSIPYKSFDIIWKFSNKVRSCNSTD
jgi:hypothetical protein